MCFEETLTSTIHSATVRGRLNRSPPLRHFWASNLFPWLNQLSLPIWSGMKDPHAHQRKNIIWCNALWETFTYFFRKQNAVFRLCCVLINTRESAIASRVWVYVRLCVCTSWYISRWSVYYCFCPCLKASDWQGAKGAQQRRVLAHPVRGREWQASSASGASRNKDDNGERDWTTQMAEPSTQRCHPYHINTIHTPTREDHAGKNN